MEFLVVKADVFGLSEFLKTLFMNGSIDRKGLPVVLRAHCSLKPRSGYRGLLGEADHGHRYTRTPCISVAKIAGLYFLMLISLPVPMDILGIAASLAPIWLS